MKFIKTFIIIFIAIIGFANSSFAQDVKTPTVLKALETKTVTVKVKNVTCPVDLQLMVDKVAKLEGVSTCIIAKKGATTKLDISYIPSKIKLAAIHTAIENSGTCEDPNDRRFKIKQ